MLVTVALPGLESAVVRVPEYAWVAGEHLLIGPALGTFLGRLLPEGTVPEDPREQPA